MNKLKPILSARKDCTISYTIVILAFILIQTMIATGNITSSLKGQLVPICAYIVMAISLNLTVGILGELSLGHAGFMSVGAFTGIVVSASLAAAIPNGPLRLAISMIVGGLFAGIAGLIVGIPVLRLKGDYLAIVTLAFGEIIKNIINVLYIGLDEKGLHFSLLEQHFTLAEGGSMIINGPMGVGGVQKLSTFSSGVVLILITLFLVLNLIHSRTGRAIMAVRDNIDRTADHDGRASLGTDLPGKIRMPAQIAFRTQGVKVRVHPLGCADPFRQIRDFRNIALNDVKTDFPEQHRCCFIAKTGSPHAHGIEYHGAAQPVGLLPCRQHGLYRPLAERAYVQHQRGAMPDDLLHFTQIIGHDGRTAQSQRHVGTIIDGDIIGNKMHQRPFLPYGAQYIFK